MRTFRRISAIVISLAMIMSCAFSSVAFAAMDFNDVADNNPYYRAIEDLVDKGIINGIDNGDGTFSFNPDGTIKRSEFAKMIAVADAPNNYSFTAPKSSFTDVAEDHWAKGYIEYAVNRKIINGMGDGTFAPDAPVTYAQAIKMIVCALNYGFAVEESNPWYQSYLDIANRLNLTKNAMSLPDNPAPRGLIAQLIYNMNNTAPAVQTGTDSEGKPIYSAGDSTKEEDSKGTKTYEGILYGVFNETITGDSLNLNKVEALVDDGDEEEIFNIGSYSVEDIAEFLGYEVEVTYSEDNAGDFIIERISKTKSNEEYAIADLDISEVTNSTVEYYDDNAKNGIDEIEFSDNIYVLYNGEKLNSGTSIKKALDIETGEIKFIDNNGDGTMDVAFVKSYKTMFVGSTTNSKGKYTVYDKYFDTTKAVVFDENDDDLIVNLLSSGSDKLSDGKLSNIAKDNVLSVAETDAGRVVEIIVSKDTASGAVKSVDKTNKTVKIGNATYEFSAYYDDAVANGADMELSVDDSAKVYLDYTGKIIAVDKTEVSSSYGYIIKVGPASNNKMDETNYKARLVDANGSVKDYPVATTGLKINGEGGKTPSDLADAVEDAATTVNKGKPDGTTKDSEGNPIESIVTNATQAVLVKYTLSGGNLKTVTIAATPDGIKDEYLADANALTYNSSSNSFGSAFKVSSSTKVFVVPADRADTSDYKVTTVSSYFKNGMSYIVDAYDAEKEGEPARVVVAYGEKSIIAPNAATVLVKNIKDTSDSEGEPVKLLTYYTVDDLDTEKTINTKANDTLGSVAAGDIIKFSTTKKDGEDVIDKIQHIFDVSADEIVADTSVFKDEDGNGMVDYSIAGHSEYHAIYGTVTYKDDKSENISIKADGKTAAVDFTIGGGTKVVKYDPAESNGVSDVFVVGDKAAIVGENIFVGENADKSGASKVFAYRSSYTGALSGIIIYK